MDIDEVISRCTGFESDEGTKETSHGDISPGMNRKERKVLEIGSIVGCS